MITDETIINCSSCPIILAGAVILPPGESVNMPAGMFDRIKTTAAEPGCPVVVEVWKDNVIRFPAERRDDRASGEMGNGKNS
jgi:hypothetical protein